MNQKQMETMLKSLLTNLLDAWQNGRDKMDVPAMPAGMDAAGVYAVETYAEARMMTRDNGVVLWQEDDHEFAITVYKRN